jgi:hypothetical protein
MTRAQIEARVDELAAAHRGKRFVAAVRELSTELDQDERDVLGAVLLERAGTFERAAQERARVRGWLRRTLDPFQRVPTRRGPGAGR